MTQEGKDRVITRAIHFIATNTKKDSHRIGQAIIAELELVKKLTSTNVSPIDCVEHEHNLEFDVVTIQEISTDSFRVYLPKYDEHVVIIEDYFQEKKTIDVVDFNNLMNTLCSVKDY